MIFKNQLSTFFKNIVYFLITTSIQLLVKTENSFELFKINALDKK